MTDKDVEAAMTLLGWEWNGGVLRYTWTNPGPPVSARTYYLQCSVAPPEGPITLYMWGGWVMYSYHARACKEFYSSLDSVISRWYAQLMRITEEDTWW